MLFVNNNKFDTSDKIGNSMLRWQEHRRLIHQILVGKLNAQDLEEDQGFVGSTSFFEIFGNLEKRRIWQ